MWKLKLDDKGQPVLKDGKPVYENAEGKEMVFDANQAFEKIGALTGENTAYKKKFTEAEEKLKGFEGIEDGAAAIKALETVKNLKDGELITAGKVEEIKTAAKKAAEDQVREASLAYDKKIADLTGQLSKSQVQLEDHMIGGGFSGSKYIADNLVIPADMVKATFGNRFKIKDGKVVALKADGSDMYSVQNPGEIAGFEEALEMIVGQYPGKDKILKSSGQSGAGTSANQSGNSGKRKVRRAEFDAMDAAGQQTLARDKNVEFVD